jgi:hypothetical protein
VKKLGYFFYKGIKIYFKHGDYKQMTDFMGKENFLNNTVHSGSKNE